MLASLRMERVQRSLEEKARVGGCHSCFEGCMEEEVKLEGDVLWMRSASSGCG